MKPREELDLILKLIKKYRLPLSPILEYAIKEKKCEYPEDLSNEPINDSVRLATVINTQCNAEEKKGVSYSSYSSVAYDCDDRKRLYAVLKAIEKFCEPATPYQIKQEINEAFWDEDISVDSVDSLLKRLPEVEYVPWGKYILKNRK